MLLRSLICGAVAAARVGELIYSRRNIAQHQSGREGDRSRRIFPLIIAVHTTAILGTWLFGDKLRAPWLVLLLAVQPLRAWVLLSLRHRWNARGVVATDLDVVTTGPYAYVRHPNYTVVAVELAALPAAFGLGRLATFVSLANAPLLWLRIREEEALLFELPGYATHFRDKPRFLPFLV